MLQKGNTERSSLLFYLLSHHDPEKLQRTFHLRFIGRDLYLCARCFGKYSGLLSAIISSLFLSFPSWLYCLIFVFFPFPSTVDWTTQKFGLRESKNWIRGMTGYLLGLAQGYLILSFIKGMTGISLFGMAIVTLYLFSIAFLLAKRRKKENRNEKGK